MTASVTKPRPAKGYAQARCTVRGGGSGSAICVCVPPTELRRRGEWVAVRAMFAVVCVGGRRPARARLRAPRGPRPPRAGILVPDLARPSDHSEGPALELRLRQ